MKKKTILLLKADAHSDLEIQSALDQDYQISIYSTRAQLMKALSESHVDMVLLDMSITECNGFDLLHELKNHSQWKNVPVIVLTAETSVADKVRGLSLGADDYIVRPFEPLELRARIDSRMRFSHSRISPEKVMRRGSFELDPSRGRFFITESNGKRELSLTPYEFRLLTLFLEREGHILSRDQLMKDVWGENTYVLPRTVDRHISALRAKIDARWGHLDTVHGVGYRFALSPFQT